MLNLDYLFRAFPRLETGRLVLRQLHLSDAKSLFAILADEKVTRFYDDEAFTEVSQARDQLESWARGFDAERSVRWGITLREDSSVIGTCGYYGFHGWHARASIGYELARAHWRQGIMTEALEAIVGFGFGNVGLNRIQAVVMPGNEGSDKLLEKLGFTREGILKGYENWGEKGYVDVSMFSLLRHEYER